MNEPAAGVVGAGMRTSSSIGECEGLRRPLQAQQHLIRYTILEPFIHLIGISHSGTTIMLTMTTVSHYHHALATHDCANSGGQQHGGTG